jgi:CheY-like chemotaxis protein
MKTRILVVDDDPQMRNWLKKLLEEKGYKVIVSTDGMSALTRLTNENRNRGKVHLILTDTQMPCLTGPELLKEITDRNIKIPMIGMSKDNEKRSLYQNFWHKDEAYKILFDLIRNLTTKSP